MVEVTDLPWKEPSVKWFTTWFRQIISDLFRKLSVEVKKRVEICFCIWYNNLDLSKEKAAEQNAVSMEEIR